MGPRQDDTPSWEQARTCWLDHANQRRRIAMFDVNLGPSRADTSK